MTVFHGFVLGVFVACVYVGLLATVMLVRNEIVYSVRMKVLAEGFDVYETLPSYDRMMWMFSCWTRKAFVAKAKRRAARRAR